MRLPGESALADVAARSGPAQEPQTPSSEHPCAVLEPPRGRLSANSRWSPPVTSVATAPKAVQRGLGASLPLQSLGRNSGSGEPRPVTSVTAHPIGIALGHRAQNRLGEEEVVQKADKGNWAHA